MIWLLLTKPAIVPSLMESAKKGRLTVLARLEKVCTCKKIDGTLDKGREGLVYYWWKSLFKDCSAKS